MIPSIIELMPSVLKVLADGKLHGKKEIVDVTAAEFGVTESEMKEKLKYGASKYKNRIGWALINLKNKELIAKDGKEYLLTDSGKKAVAASPARLTAKFVKSLSDKKDDRPDKKDSSGDSDQNGGEGSSSAKEEKAVETSAAEAGEKPVAEETSEAETVDMSMFDGVDPECDFMLVLRAKSGDNKAFTLLWKKYKPTLVPMFRHCKNLTEKERESEAALVLVRKIELFKAHKVKKEPLEWTFSYMLTGGAKNSVDKIIKHSKKDGERYLTYNEVKNKDIVVSSDNPVSCVLGGTLKTAMEYNKFEYDGKYSPQEYALRATDVSLEEREKELMNNLSPLQITVLQLRQAGKTIQEIADEMGCGFTKVRLSIVKAREIASSIFQVNYC